MSPGELWWHHQVKDFYRRSKFHTPSPQCNDSGNRFPHPHRLTNPANFLRLRLELRLFCPYAPVGAIVRSAGGRERKDLSKHKERRDSSFRPTVASDYT